MSLRILFVARKVDHIAGGLERMLVDLMNEMVRRGFQVGLVTWDSDSATPHYEINSKVAWLKLDCGDPSVPAPMSLRIRRLIKFRSFVKSFHPSVVVGFQSGAALFAWVATLGIKLNVICSERVSPDMWRYVRTRLHHKFFDIYLLRVFYRITTQFPEYIEKYPVFLQGSMIAIPNPVHKIPFVSNVNRYREKIILYVARFCFQKNHELLIRAFSDLQDEFVDWRLVLAGDGEYLVRIKELVATSGLNRRVEFLGAVREVSTLYNRANVIAFPSLFEGFPNALAEALACGIPCVGLRSTLGVNSLIREGVNGFLVDSNPQAFAEGLRRLMSNDELRVAMSEPAKAIVDMYEPQRSYGLWESLFWEASKQ